MMKSKQIIIILLIMLFINSIGLSFPIEQNKIDMVKPRIHAAISPIVITSSEEFHTQAALYGWNADGRDGSRGNAYLISNDTIDGGSRSIDIQNTRVYFIIEYCNLTSASSYGIYLENVTYGIISENWVNNTITGIQIKNSQHIQVRSNTIENINHAIYLYQGVNSSIIDSNTIDTGKYGGITVQKNCNNNQITNNEIYDVGDTGIKVDESNGNNVSANVIDGLLNSGARGITVHLTNDSFFNWNTVVNGTKYGFIISSLSCHNEIAYNNFTETGEVGIYVWDEWAKFNSFHDNYIDYHYVGIVTGNNNSVYENYVQQASDGISVNFYSNVSTNHIYNCSTGIQINDEFSLVEDNYIDQCSTGIYADYSVNNTVSANHIHNSSYSAISMTQSYDFTFIDNNITDCAGDLRFSVSHVNQLRHTFINNLVDGKEIVYFEDTVNPIIPADIRRVILINCSDFDISGHIFEHTTTAIMAFECSNFNIHHNVFRYIYVTLESQLCENVTFTNNEIHNGTGTGLFLFNIENLLIFNNFIHHSTFLQSSYQAAIYLYRVKFVKIITNEFYQNTGYALLSTVSQNITFVQNQIRYMGGGITSSNDQYLTISNSIFINCSYGLRFFSSNFGDIYGNWIENVTQEGVYLSNAQSWFIQFNNFINNNVLSAENQSTDINGIFIKFTHNYWNDHDDEDADSDGYKDSKYLFSSNEDNESLAVPYIISLPSLLTPTSGAVVNKTITISWMVSTDTMGFDLLYYIYLSPDNGDSWIVLESKLDVTSFQLNTSELENGTYLISVLAVNEAFSIYSEFISDPFEILNLPPQITEPTIIYPSDGSTIGGTINIFWDASVDIWNSSTPVLYSVYYSSDDGTTWHEIAVDISVTDQIWPSNNVNDGDYLIKVVAYTANGLVKENIVSFTVQNTITSTTENPTTTTTATTTTTETTSPSDTTDGNTSSTAPTGSISPGFTLLPLFYCSIIFIFLKKRK